LYLTYHDTEWGIPERNSKALFEKLILGGSQAGLSWITILRKRDNYMKAFDGLDPVKVARYSDAKLEMLMKDPGIMRNRLKILSVRSNARAFLRLRNQGIYFSEFLWEFVGGKPIQNSWKTMDEVPSVSPEAEAMSKALKKEGFNFVGPTIIYAFKRAVGMVNDHLVNCFRYGEYAQ